LACCFSSTLSRELEVQGRSFKFDVVERKNVAEMIIAISSEGFF